MSAITILPANNVPAGPFTREQIAEKLQSGECSLDQLAFIDGLTQWTPLRDILAKLDASAPVPAFVPPPAPQPVSPGYASAAVATATAPVVYAGFWLRFVAWIIDSIILFIPGAILGGIVGFVFGVVMANRDGNVSMTDSDGNLNPAFVLMELVAFFVGLIVGWLYFSLMESSSGQATVGKRVLGLKVTDLHGNRIGFARATGRFFGKFLSGIILYVGYIMAGFTERKQALHDILAGTLVVKK